MRLGRHSDSQKRTLSGSLLCEVILLRLEGGQVNKYTNGELKCPNLLYFYITRRTPMLGGWARWT